MPDSSPKMLQGAVVEQRVRCGRTNCRCARGQPHAAHYRYWWDDGRRRKAYVRRADLKATRAGYARWREADAVKAAILSSPAADEVRRQMRDMVREALGEQSNTPGGQRALRRLRGYKR